MMTVEKHQIAGLKKPYSKPILGRVVLKPEEAVLGACKSAADFGPSAGSCTILSCNVVGS
jgi:hypothetical protein